MNTATIWVLRAVVLAIVCVLWEWSSGRLLDEVLVSRPSAIVQQMIVWTAEGRLPAALGATVVVVVSGILWGTLAGVSLGMLFGLSRLVDALFGAAMTGLFALPKVALVPLFILWFGLGYLERTVFTATVVFFFAFFATSEGVQRVPRPLENMLRLLGATLPQRLIVLYLPATAGWVLSALRIATPYAVLATVGAEVIASREGLGHLARASGNILNTAGTMSAVVTAMLLAVAAASITNWCDRHWRWHLHSTT